MLERCAIGGASEDTVALDFCCSLATQCFINEYIFDLEPGELERAETLRASLSAELEAGRPVPAMVVAMVAAYFPLHMIEGAQRLLGRSWPAAVSALVDRQVSEPRRERELAQTIPRINEIDDEYEQNPYPRWIKGAVVEQATDGRDLAPSVCDSVARPVCRQAKYRHSRRRLRNRPPFDHGGFAVLGSNVLAVDLSLASLSFAKRKATELAIRNIEYAQADILQLATIGRSFDIVESSGVLHHLADPSAGLRILSSLLRPGGLMFIGLYSELGRRDVVAARGFIAERRYGSTAHEIRQCRQELMTCGNRAVMTLTHFTDFFSLSECRDLLFHVQEHRFTSLQIKKLLSANGLRFIAFEHDSATKEKYRARFPADEAMIDLDLWHAFEQDNPDTFRGMYQFWVQKEP